MFHYLYLRFIRNIFHSYLQSIRNVCNNNIDVLDYSIALKSLF